MLQRYIFVAKPEPRNFHIARPFSPFDLHRKKARSSFHKIKFFWAKKHIEKKSIFIWYLRKCRSW